MHLAKYKSLPVIIKFLVSVTLVLYLMNMIKRQDLSIINMNVVGYILESICILFLAQVIQAWRWKRILNLFKQASMRELIRLYIIGAFFNVFLPGAIGGDIIRATYSSRKYDLELTKASFIILVERVAGMVGLSIIFSVGLMFYSNNELLNISQWLPLIVFGIIVIGIISFKFWASKKAQISYAFIINIILLSILGQYADIIIGYNFSRYFQLNLDVYQYMIIMPLVYVVTVLPISFGGTGVREGAMIALLSLFGVERSVAIFISLLMYIVKVILGLSGLPLYLFDKKI